MINENLSDRWNSPSTHTTLLLKPPLTVLDQSIIITTRPHIYPWCLKFFKLIKKSSIWIIKANGIIYMSFRRATRDLPIPLKIIFFNFTKHFFISNDGWILLQHQVFQRYYYFCPNHLSLCSKSFPSNFIHVLDTCFSLLHILHEHTSI